MILVSIAVSKNIPEKYLVKSVDSLVEASKGRDVVFNIVIFGKLLDCEFQAIKRVYSKLDKVEIVRVPDRSLDREYQITNLSLRASHSEASHYGIIDADDMVSPNYFDEILGSSPNSILVTHPIRVDRATGEAIPKFYLDYDNFSKESVIQGKTPPVVWGVFLPSKMRTYVDRPSKSETLGGEYKIVLSIWSNVIRNFESVTFLDKAIYKWMYTPGSLSTTVGPEFFKESLKFLSKHPENEEIARYQWSIIKTFLRMVMDKTDSYLNVVSYFEYVLDYWDFDLRYFGEIMCEKDKFIKEFCEGIPTEACFLKCKSFSKK